MELKEYIGIFKKRAKLFFGTAIFVILGVFIYLLLQPITYNTSLTLNITRSGSQNSSDYRYDDFYRLQADEKFADTVVQWLKSPRLVSDIYREAGLNVNQLSLGKLARAIKAEKLSSQIVAVTFSAKNPESAKKISNAIYRIISQNADSLNVEQKEINWFKIVAPEPVIILNKFDPLVILAFSLFLGFFVAFWMVLIAHYLE